MAAGASGRRRATGRRGGRLRALTRAAARGGGVAGGRGVDGRIRLLRFAFIVFLVLVGGKAVALASSSENLTRIALQQQTATVVLPAHRGAILDRNGRELAVGKPAQTVFATPYLLDDPQAAARTLCKALRITKKRERRALEKALAQPKSGFAYVARKIDPELAKAALALDLPGVGAYAEEERSYPMKGSAAQVLGFAGIDGNGLAGLEMEYDKQLAGVAGSEVIVRDPAGHALRTVRQTQPTSGASVRLTLDEDIQYTAEDVLEHTVRSSSATAATAIVMDPRSGEILAMANVPTVEDNDFGRTPAFNRNRCVTDIYEPGSIFKLVTISGALADGLVKPTTKFTLPSSLTLYDRTINESHARGTVTYSVREILQWSSNVGAVTIGMKMGKERLLKWMDAFGFAAPTGIDFPGEAAGIVPPADKWSGTSIVNIPMGQGIAVTPIQMAVAFSTVANSGVAVKPRLIAQLGDAVYGGMQKHRVISAKVARDVRSMLATAVAEGTGTKAQIPGYEVAGKTGTAEKPLPDGSGYSKTDYVASFIGMVPADHPRLVVLVAVDSPRTSIYGGDIAAPAVQKIMRFALQQLEIAP
ncbi:MAG: penicillin-binding protein 2 [Actinobacteria bacterium]|nr:penicillin-binding protein 2 [Actinomycetota bacterium]